MSDRHTGAEALWSPFTGEETLDNADSYGAHPAMHAGINTQLVTPQADTATGCSQPAVPLEAFARIPMECICIKRLQTDVSLLRGAALSTLNLQPALLNTAFPNVTSTADLVALTMPSHHWSKWV